MRLQAIVPPANIDWLDAQDLLDELCEDQLTLGMNLACLERAIQVAARDASTRVVVRTLELRVGELAALRDALGRLYAHTADARVHRLFVPDASLSDYLRGIYAWVHAVMRALGDLAGGIGKQSPDWGLYRFRIEEAKNFHFHELDSAIEEDLTTLALVASPDDHGKTSPPIAPLSDAIGEVFTAAHALERGLDERVA